MPRLIISIAFACALCFFLYNTGYQKGYRQAHDETQTALEQARQQAWKVGEDYQNAIAQLQQAKASHYESIEKIIADFDYSTTCFNDDGVLLINRAIDGK